MGHQGEMLMSELKKYNKLLEYKKYEKEEDFTNKKKELWKEWLINYGERILLDCKEEKEIIVFNEKRVKLLNENNPKFVLRNYIAEKAIKAAKNGDYEELNKLRDLFRNPFLENVDPKFIEYASRPPSSVGECVVTCSS